MKHLLIILGLLLVGSTTYGQITISRDSIISNSEFIGRYTSIRSSLVRYELIINVNALLDHKQKMEIEATIVKLLFSEERFKDFYFSFTYILDEDRISPTQISGLRFEEAGKAYNGAAALSIIGAVGGSALVLSGYPIAGSIITLSSSVIAFIVQINGNNKLIKGGESLQKQK